MSYKDREERLAYEKNYRETHRDKMSAYYKAHRDEILAYQRQYYKEHKDKKLAYYKEHRDERLACEKLYREQNKDKCKQLVKAWEETHQEQRREIDRKHKFKRRSLGFVPLNQPFEGSDAHHVCRTFVIYIPKDMHRSIYHNVWTGENMEEINKLAWEFFKFN